MVSIPHKVNILVRRDQTGVFPAAKKTGPRGMIPMQAGLTVGGYLKLRTGSDRVLH